MCPACKLLFLFLVGWALHHPIIFIFQLPFRQELIKNLKQLNDKLDLSLSTFHLAVHLLDIFMDCHEIDQQQLMLAGSTCLLIAGNGVNCLLNYLFFLNSSMCSLIFFQCVAKYVDVDSNVPKFSHLQSLTNHHNSIHEFSLMEKVSKKYDYYCSSCA